MRVTITHGEQRAGIVFRKTYATVTLAIEFSEEEKQVIKKNRLGGLILVERDPPANIKSDGGDFNLYIRQILRKPDTYVLENQIMATKYEEYLKEHLQFFKNALERGGSDDFGSQTFEL